MEARILRAALIVAAALSLGAGRPNTSARSQHFVVTAPTPQLAQEVCQAAETYRRDLAIEWLGHELPEWRDVCPITVKLDPGAGGATSFVFQGGMPTQWTMQIQGSRERILDSVLPHEITHTVFATHFGRPLPRWADEGACTTVEHASEKAKQDNFLVQFLTSVPSRGIPFNQMFKMKEYPRDILPLYSQGYSLARYLIEQGGKRKFVEYVGVGMRTNDWTSATRTFYGFSSLSDLQVTWVEWVRHGSPPRADSTALASATTQPAAPATQMASLMQQQRSRVPDGALASWQTVQAQNARALAQADQHETPPPPNFAAPAPVPVAASARGDYSSVSRPVSDGWYVRQRDQAQAVLGSAASSPPSGPPEQQPAASRNVPPPPTRSARAESEPLMPAVHNAPVAPAPANIVPASAVAPSANRQVLLEWVRPADQPYEPSGALTGVALGDRGTLRR